MLRVVTGPFYPDLERELGDELHRLKAEDPLVPVALVVPSTSLVTHLRRLLVAEHGCALLNVHLLTFHQFALRLYAEQGTSREKAAPLSRVDVLPDFFFEHLLSQLAQRELGRPHPLRATQVGAGTWTALWRTIRDLQDAAVDPAVALRAVEEGVFGREDAEEMQALFLLQAAFSESCRTLKVGLLDDLAAAVTPWTRDSPFLQGLTRVCYYGFYDLTQVQLALFEAVVAQSPVTLYFPLEADASFAFAQRFFERHISPLATTAGQIVKTTSAAARASAPTRRRQAEVLSTVGVEDELAAAARQILALVETHGYRFDHIGVVARTLEPYQRALPRIFRAHRIPFSSTGVAPLVHEPAVKVLLQLASLPVNDLHREAMLDVLTSPFSIFDRVPRAETEGRPDLWRLAVRTLGIIRGEAQWRKLAGVDGVEVWGRDQAGDGDPAVAGFVDPRQVGLLWEVVRALVDGVRELPRQGCYADLTVAFQTLAERHLSVPGLRRDWREDDELDVRRRAVGAAIARAMAMLSRLDALEVSVPYATWAETLVRVMERASIPIAATESRGVQVLDAMAARGLSFEALIVLGLNEKVFPRYIQEDPFLHDRHRRVLGDTLGYKIDEKLDGYEEEALLFTLLSQAARKRLCVTYQRADEDGRPLVPSPYLAGIRDGGAQETLIPRRLTERTTVPHCAPLLTSAGELILRVVLTGEDATPLLAASEREAALFAGGRQALRHLETAGAELGPHDGLTGPLDTHWERLLARGVAPTSLEAYARCPYQYFAAHVLQLEDIRTPVPDELPAHALGKVLHRVLRVCYQQLVALGWPQVDLEAQRLREVVEGAAQGAFDEYERGHATGHALTWRMTRDRLCELVTVAVLQDRADLLRRRFRPVAFEVEASGRLDAAFGEAYRGLLVRGRLDRIDRGEDPPALKVVDYKYKQGRALKPEDTDLLTSGVRGRNLQPPLYLLMEPSAVPALGAAAEATALRPERVEFLFLAPHSALVVDRAELPASVWQSAAGTQLRDTLRLLLDGVQAGRFPILPGGHCDYCEFSAMCRRTHGPTWMRAHRAEPARALRQLKVRRVSRETRDSHP